jgi:hypothetical protein
MAAHPKKRIAICRLRQNVAYAVPLTTILDSFYECLLHFVSQHSEHEFSFYKFSLSQMPEDKPRADADALVNADVIIIPTEAEFTYWVPGKLHTGNVAASNAKIDEIKRLFRSKRIILLRSDRADSIDLYREKTLRGVDADYRVIDEDEFPLGIHGMKYHFIKHHTRYWEQQKRMIDFAYWGSDKRKLPNGQPSGDQRHKVLRELQRSSLSSIFFGSIYGVSDHQKWSNDFRPVIKSLWNARATLCFNWLDQNALTARFGEALACGVMPFVWEDYDAKKRAVSDDWLRIREPSELIDKLKDRSFNRRLAELRVSYEEKLPSLDEYKTDFAEKLTRCL